MQRAVVLAGGSPVLVTYPVLQRHSTGLEMDAAHRCHAKPSALRLATVEASMSCALVGTCDVASD